MNKVKTTGIIAEYNPFHNGHKYHIEKARELCGADAVVVVMSGNFTQRGEPAAIDKFARARAALSGGADLVVELPVVFACQSAQRFAAGGVALLEAIGCDFLSFGAETDDVKSLQKAADFFNKNDTVFTQKLTDLLKEGVSYPRAVSEASGVDILDTPNNTLAIEYLKANRTMTPVAIKRHGSLHDQIGSALDIRAKIYSGEAYDHLVPNTTAEVLCTSPIADLKAFENLVLYKLRTSAKGTIASAPDVTEGLENRIYDAVLKSSSLEELYNNIKTKRYTLARIRRILTNIVLGITKDDVNLPPQYIRVLGMNEKGREILAKARKESSLPLITKTADAKMCRMLECDILASDVYSVITHTPASKDFKQTPIII